MEANVKLFGMKEENEISDLQEILLKSAENVIEDDTNH